MVRKKKKPSIQVSRIFGLILGIVSMVGFASIILNSFFNISLLIDYNEAILLSLLGVGMIFEGKLFKLFKTAKDGISSAEFRKWVTSIIGLAILISGIFAFVGFSTPVISALKGISSLIALIIIGVEIFLVK